MLNITDWTPPCGCHVHYSWDSDEPEATRKHTYLHPSDAPKVRPDKWRIEKGKVVHTEHGREMVEKKCLRHAHLKGQALLESLLRG